MKALILTIAAQLFLIAGASAQVVFYNVGKISAKGNSNDSTSIYISGDMRVLGNATTTSQIVVEQTKIKLLGDFINDVPMGNVGGIVFGSPVAPAGVFEFCGAQQQKITTSGTDVATIPSKLENYINFPNLKINNNKHVVISPRLAMKTKNIELEKGWLILESELAQTQIHGGNEVNPAQESVLAHLLVDGTINYKQETWAAKNPEDRGFIQVNLKVPNEGNQTEKSIIGFGSPFSKMRADYFAFNTLLQPAPAGFLANPPITEPKTALEAGKGYVVGIDLRGDNEELYPPLEEYEGVLNFSQRSKGDYRFNRMAFAEYAPHNQLFGLDPTNEAYLDEKLNTTDVSVTLSEGYNYLANPYTSPLNIDKLLGNNEAQSTWNIQADELSTMPQVRNRVWILAPNSVAEPGSMPSKSKYTYNYQVAMRTGGTYIDNDNVQGVTSIAPLQMFLVRAYPTAQGTTITIPAAERVMGTTRFLRNTSADNRRRDDFVLEFRDLTTKTTDRLSLVLRTSKEIAENKNYSNVERLVSTSSDGGNGTTRSAEAINGDFEQSLASQIYSKDASGKALSVQFLPLESTEKIQLYHIPSSTAQPIEIIGLRINTKEKVDQMWLEDKLTKSMVEITPTMKYETYSNPTDATDRFVIHIKQGSGMEEIDDLPGSIYAYQQADRIIVRGFADSDAGNKVSFYNMNGQRIDNQTVVGKELESTDIFISGVYIIKMEGTRTQSVKVVVK